MISQRSLSRFARVSPFSSENVSRTVGTYTREGQGSAGITKEAKLKRKALSRALGRLGNNQVSAISALLQTAHKRRPLINPRPTAQPRWHCAPRRARESGLCPRCTRVRRDFGPAERSRGRPTAHGRTLNTASRFIVELHRRHVHGNPGSSDVTCRTNFVG